MDDEVLDDGTRITYLDSWDPRTPHTEMLRWHYELADGSDLEFVGRVHTEIGTRGYGHQTAEQLADRNWAHHEGGWCDHIEGTAVGQTVTMQVPPTESIYDHRRRLWVAPAPTLRIRQVDWTNTKPRTTSTFWYLRTTNGQFIEEEFPWEPPWDWTTPQGQVWRLNIPKVKRVYYSSGLKQVTETLAYRMTPFADASEAWQEDGPLERTYGEILESFEVIDPALWPKGQA